ncbi:MAG: PRC-barrel domain-containing protein [Actinomycetota bacterium]|nr:PRC-barrel domain-containing protein [Actinomycetota bacterium]
MRAHDLIGSRVFTEDGQKLGRVFDLEATRTGPKLNDIEGRAFELKGLLVGSGALLQRLGFHRTEMRGPVGLKFIVERMKGYRVPWECVDQIEEHEIRLLCTKSDLGRIDNH